MDEPDLDVEAAQREVVALFGNGSLIEQKVGGFIVWRASEPGAVGGPEGMSLASREIIGTGATRRAAIDCARRATGR